MREPRRVVLCFVVVACLATVVRVALIPRFPLESWGDGPGYISHAVQILKGEVMGSPDSIAQRGPVYPAFIALVYLVTPDDHAWILVAQAFLAVGTAALGFTMARRHGSDWRALLVGGTLVVYPPLLYWGLKVLSDAPFVFFLALCLFFTDRAIHGARTLDKFLVGLTAALMTLCRPTGMVCAPFLLGGAALSRRQPGRLDWRGAACATLAFVLPLGLWTWRNYELLGVPVFSTTTGGIMFYTGNSQQVLDDPRRGEEVFYGDKALMEKVAAMGEVAGDRYLFDLGKTYLLSDPARAVHLFWRKLLFFLKPFPEAGPLVRWISCLSYLGAIAIAASVFLASKGALCRMWLLSLGLILAMTMLHVVYYGMGRYRLSVEAVLIMMGGFASVSRAGPSVSSGPGRERSPGSPSSGC